MRNDPVRGRTIAFTFDDGPMAGRTFEHRFDDKGTVTFRAAGNGASAAEDEESPGPSTKYEVATVRDGVCAISYLGSGGYTLTVVLDFATNKLVAFSSNDKALSMQHGTFHETPAAVAAKARMGVHPAGARH